MNKNTKLIDSIIIVLMAAIVTIPFMIGCSKMNPEAAPITAEAPATLHPGDLVYFKGDPGLIGVLDSAGHNSEGWYVIFPVNPHSRTDNILVRVWMSECLFAKKHTHNVVGTIDLARTPKP